MNAVGQKGSKTMKVIESITNKVTQFGIGMNVKELASKMYWQMKAEGHDVCIINERYLECDGQSFQFIKSRVNGCWKVKTL